MSSTGAVRDEFDQKNVGRSKGSQVQPEEYGVPQRNHEYNRTERAHGRAKSTTGKIRDT